MDGTDQATAVTAAVDRSPGCRAAGCVAAEEEAEELVRAAPDGDGLQRMVDRRLTGEPLAWITGETVFCGLAVAIEPGVFVPRWQSEPLALMAAQLLPPEGIGVDLCTGSGAVAMVMQSAHPGGRRPGHRGRCPAARCARGNGVAVVTGDLDQPLPAAMAPRVDVMTGVLPYVPTRPSAPAPGRAGVRAPGRPGRRPGRDGRGVEGHRRSPRWVRLGGWLLLEIGGDQVIRARETLVGGRSLGMWTYWRTATGTYAESTGSGRVAGSSGADFKAADRRPIGSPGALPFRPRTPRCPSWGAEYNPGGPPDHEGGDDESEIHPRDEGRRANRTSSVSVARGPTSDSQGRSDRALDELLHRSGTAAWPSTAATRVW